MVLSKGLERHPGEVLMALALLLLYGCGTTMHVTKESAIGQELIYQSLDHAISDLNVSKYNSGKIAVKLYAQTDNGLQGFADQYMVDRLKERGLDIVEDESEADRIFDVFVSVLGLNRGKSLFGLPAIATPFGVTTPELAIYKSERNRGQVNIKIYTFDARTGEFVGKTGTFSGGAYYNRHKVLLFINFTRTDLDE